MKVGIWHLSKKPMNGELLRREPAGGTETAVVYTAEALARAGAEVTVFCRTEGVQEHEDVRYEPAETFRARAGELVFDAFVVVRHLAALTVPVRTRALYYWTHDNLAQPFMHGMLRTFEGEGRERKRVDRFPLGELMAFLDGVFAVSRFQANAICGRLGVPRERIEVVGNGLPPHFAGDQAPLKDRAPVVLYSLPPDRGFLPLLEIFARVQPHCPEAELHLYSRSTIYGSSPEEDEREYGELYAAARTLPGVRHFDPVDQPTLAKAMSRAMVYAYPTTTDETFCISLLEAQAAGLVAVASPRGAIPERIRSGTDGYLVPGDPDDPVCQARFADRLLRILGDGELRRTIGQQAMRRASDEDSTYDSVAARMLARLEPLVRKRDPRTVGFDVPEVLAPLCTRFQELLLLG